MLETSCTHDSSCALSSQAVSILGGCFLLFAVFLKLCFLLLNLSLEPHLLFMILKRFFLLLLHIYRLDCGSNSICCLVGFLEVFFDFSAPCFYCVLALSLCELLFLYCGLTILVIDDWWRSKDCLSRFSTISSVWLSLK